MIRSLAVTLFTVALVGSQPATAQPCGSNGLSLQVLGSGGPRLAAKRAASGTLVWIDGSARLLIDAGHGVALRFGESGARLGDLDALLLTRLQADHSSDLPALVQGTRSDPRTRNLPIYGPPASRGMPSTVGFVRDLFDGTRGTWRHLGEFISPLEKSSYKLTPRDVREPAPRIGTARPRTPQLLPVLATDRLTVRALPSLQGQLATLAFRIETRGKSIVVGGNPQDDNSALAAIAADADLMLAPDSLPESADQYGQNLGQLAHLARVKQLVITARGLAAPDREERTTAAIRRHFSGPLHFADDLSCYTP